ncbi:MAG TPA: hypothetical protein VF384_17780 [Planctomycetota bacterium]
MNSILGVSIAAAALASAAASQTPVFIGFSYNAEVGATSRGSLGLLAGKVMTVIKGEDYAGWGATVPGVRTINSIFCIVQDQDAVATPETFDIKLYPEDVANPGMPNLAAGVVFASGVAGPPAPTTGTISAIVRIVTPATPVTVPIAGSGDVFVSFALPATAVATDGLSIQIVLGYQPSPTFTVFDIPGATQSPDMPITVGNTHGMTLVPPTTLTLNRRRNQLIDVAHIGAGGVVMGITNQTSLLGSANPPPTGFGPAPGTADFMSGVSPDVVGINPGRADDITFDYFRGTAAAGNFVFFFADFGTFGPEIPLALVFPGSTGVVCMNLTFFQLGSGVCDAQGEAFLVTAFPAALRPLAAGLNIVQQAVELDFAGGVFHTSPCGRQQL